jgi:tetratricopeptide (TPR) repeat protein
MKRVITLLAFVFAISGVFAQKGKVTSAQNLKNSGKLVKAIEVIKITIDPSNSRAQKTIPWPKTWEVRGEIYQAIYKSKDENVKKLCADPLTIAFDSYKKALELDTKKKYSKSIKIKLTLLVNDLTDQAVKAFQASDFDKALTSFENILAIQNIDVIKKDNPNAVDTSYLFNSGLAAANAKKYDKAIKYYGKAAKYGYNGARTWLAIARAYQAKEDTIGALNTLKEAFQKYPDDNDVVTGMIQIYMQLDKSDEALKYLELAIKQDPTNVTYYMAQGVLYEKMLDEEKAIQSYKRANEVDKTFFNAYYNLGTLFYNKGVKQENIAINVPPNENEKYLAEKKKADVWFTKALPYMVKCYELNPKDRNALEALKSIYYRAKQMDKYNEILEKLEQL